MGFFERLVRNLQRRQGQDFVARYGFDAPRKPPRRPPEAGVAGPAVPPRGPLPLQGGAEAPLEFDRD